MLTKKPHPWRINLILELTRNGWVKIRDKIIEKFGKTCKDLEYRTTIDLLDNIVPATLDIYANLFHAGENVDLRRLPTAYSSLYLPQPNLCDRCKHLFSEEDGMFLERLEGEDKLTPEDFEDDENAKKEEEEETSEEIEGISDISSKLKTKINQIIFGKCKPINT
ncbi:hypothetical protein C2G38_2261995 [Gigaspora rosea]|uniref:Uncharacterized protein n=1 Tax=Gigaspora rosea TaxID=44941 RepID=A0A397UVR0_9GLOM|nr:hypothetical protein C2G38_2261995 [Gigaspora rosea]